MVTSRRVESAYILFSLTLVLSKLNLTLISTNDISKISLHFLLTRIRIGLLLNYDCNYPYLLGWYELMRALVCFQIFTHVKVYVVHAAIHSKYTAYSQILLERFIIGRKCKVWPSIYRNKLGYIQIFAVVDCGVWKDYSGKSKYPNKLTKSPGKISRVKRVSERNETYRKYDWYYLYRVLENSPFQHL